jgi:hypothetical protein
MPDPTHPDTQLRGVRRVNAVALTATDIFVAALRHYSAKFIAARLKASTRTVEGWRQGKSAPQGRHVLAMLTDDELCARLLKEAGRGDLAHAQETITSLRKALGNVERK